MKTYKTRVPNSVAGTFYVRQGKKGSEPLSSGHSAHTDNNQGASGQSRKGAATGLGLIGGVHLWRTSRSSNRTFSRTGTPEVHDSLVPFLSAQEIKGS